MHTDHPHQTLSVVLYHSVLQSEQDDAAGVLLVPWYIVQVNVGVWTQASQLEIHLIVMFTGTINRLGLVDDTRPIIPAIPERDQEGAVLCGPTIQCLRHTNTQINIVPRIIIMPNTLRVSITSCYISITIEAMLIVTIQVQVQGQSPKSK